MPTSLIWITVLFREALDTAILRKVKVMLGQTNQQYDIFINYLTSR
jgi:hypothetical protein